MVKTKKETDRTTGIVLFLFVSDGCFSKETQAHPLWSAGRYPQAGSADCADRILQKQDISTLEQLQEFRHPLEEKMAQLLLERGQLYRSQPGCERIGKITEEMKQIRKDIRMSLRIEQYSVEMEQRMKRAKERMEQAEKNMQRKKEQIKESYVK